MAFTFPQSGTKAAAHITPHTLECLKQPHRLPTRKEAAANAKRFCETSESGATGLFTMALLADDSLALCFFGKRGGFKEVWNFGKAA